MCLGMAAHRYSYSPTPCSLLVLESPSSGLIQAQWVLSSLLLARNLLGRVLVAVLVVAAQDLHPLFLVAEQRASGTARGAANGISEGGRDFLEWCADGAQTLVEGFAC